jgi:hypothetical protein
MNYKSLQPIYLVQFNRRPIVLLKYFELDEFIEQWRHVDFVVKLKEGINFSTKHCDEKKGAFGEKYSNTVSFNEVLTVDHIDRFKLSPNLYKESYLKQIYDGKVFDMSKLNNIVMISDSFLEDNDIFDVTSKKMSNYIWIVVIVLLIIIAFFCYDNWRYSLC